MAHFLATYATASIWCADPDGVRGGGLPDALVAVYTALALAGIALAGWGGYHRHSFGAGEPPHDADTPEDRHRFLGFAAMLLAGLSAVATLYSALAAALVGRC